MYSLVMESLSDGIGSGVGVLIKGGGADCGGVGEVRSGVREVVGM